MSLIESTYKSAETEETLDIYLYRPIGFVIARTAIYSRLSPNMITSLGGIGGIISGHLFYYNNFNYTIVGILLLILSEACDSADGQLARMTNSVSRTGRIFDGFATNLIFLSIYTHLSLRLLNEGWPPWIFAIALLAGVSHSIQSGLADYYRNGYMKFAISYQKGELDSSEDIRKKYLRLSWRKDFLIKFFQRIYLNYTIQQEIFSPAFKALILRIESHYNSGLPQDLKQLYRMNSKPLIKYYNILTTNTRMFFLFFALLIKEPLYFLLFELIILNILLAYVNIKQEMISKVFLTRIN